MAGLPWAITLFEAFTMSPKAACCCTSLELELGQEVSWEFKIAEVRTSLDVRARMLRKVGTAQVGLEFNGLTPEQKNAILRYGTPQGEMPTKELHIGPGRLFR